MRFGALPARGPLCYTRPSQIPMAETLFCCGFRPLRIRGVVELNVGTRLRDAGEEYRGADPESALARTAGRGGR